MFAITIFSVQPDCVHLIIYVENTLCTLIPRLISIDIHIHDVRRERKRYRNREIESKLNKHARTLSLSLFLPFSCCFSFSYSVERFSVEILQICWCWWWYFMSTGLDVVCISNKITFFSLPSMTCCSQLVRRPSLIRVARVQRWFFSGDSNLLIRNADFDFVVVVAAATATAIPCCFLFDQIPICLVCCCVGLDLSCFFRFFYLIFLYFVYYHR